MLVIIDMQNHILDPNSEFYIPESDQLAERIAKRLAKARKTRNIFYSHGIFQSN